MTNCLCSQSLPGQKLGAQTTARANIWDKNVASLSATGRQCCKETVDDNITMLNMHEPASSLSNKLPSAFSRQPNNKTVISPSSASMEAFFDALETWWWDVSFSFGPRLLAPEYLLDHAMWPLQCVASLFGPSRAFVSCCALIPSCGPLVAPNPSSPMSHQKSGNCHHIALGFV